MHVVNKKYNICYQIVAEWKYKVAGNGSTCEVRLYLEIVLE